MDNGDILNMKPPPKPRGFSFIEPPPQSLSWLNIEAGHPACDVLEVVEVIEVKVKVLNTTVKHVCILTCTIILSFHVISPLRRPIKQASMSLAFAKSPIAFACLLCITLIPLLKEPWFFGLLILQVLLEVWLTSHIGSGA